MNAFLPAPRPTAAGEAHRFHAQQDLDVDQEPDVRRTQFRFLPHLAATVAVLDVVRRRSAGRRAGGPGASVLVRCFRRPFPSGPRRLPRRPPFLRPARRYRVVRGVLRAFRFRRRRVGRHPRRRAWQVVAGLFCPTTWGVTTLVTVLRSRWVGS